MVKKLVEKFVENVKKFVKIGQKMGTLDDLLYNMASMLAGVAVGYDVRLSNVSPIHPKLYPKRYVKLRTFDTRTGIFLHTFYLHEKFY